jgi:hypothetical protein
MCSTQENTINELKRDLALIKEERKNEMENFSSQVKQTSKNVKKKYKRKNYLKF